MKLARPPIKRIEIKIVEYDGKDYKRSVGFSVYEVPFEEVKKMIREALVKKGDKQGTRMEQKYSIINNHTYNNAVRIKTAWHEQKRYLWVLKEDLSDFLDNPDKYKVKSHLF